MKTDELQRALDDLAGDAPPLDDAYVAVTRRARRDRRRTRAGGLTVALCVFAVAVFAVTRSSPTPVRISVRNPPPAPTAGDVADLTWTRIAAPSIQLHRIVAVDGHTFAVGSDQNGAAIDELAADGGTRPLLRGTSGGGLAWVNDVIAFDGSIVAVGQDVVPPSLAQNTLFPRGRVGAAAWRSTDDGADWHRVNVEQPPTGVFVGNAPASFYGSIARIVAVHRAGKIKARQTLSAFGQTDYLAANGHCEQAAWTSDDGTSFGLVPIGSPLACGASDATDGPAGLVAVTGPRAIATAGGTQAITPGGDATFNAIASDDHGYVAVGSAGDAAPVGAIWWSADGGKWVRVVTATPPPGSDPYARFTGVVHSAAGWIAVGLQTHRDANPKVTDAILWTSADGRHWTQDTRDGGTFEQYAAASGIGTTAGGFAIFGQGNITGAGVHNDPLGADEVLWLGTSTPPSTPTGIVEGTMRVVGGPAPGADRGIAGSLTATATDGTRIEAAVTAGGRFSTTLPAGTYAIVGRPTGWSAGCGVGGSRVTVTAGAVTHITLVCSIE